MSRNVKKYLYNGKKVSFEQLPFEKRVSIMEQHRANIDTSRSDPEFRSMCGYLKNEKAKKDRAKKRAVSAIMAMRNEGGAE